MRLRMLRRTKDDTAYTICDKLRLYSSLAYPGEENSPMVVTNNICQFTELMGDSNLRREFLVRKPETLEAALQVAVSFMDDPDVKGGAKVTRDSDFDGEGRKKAQARGAEALVAASTVAVATAYLPCQKELEELKLSKSQTHENLTNWTTSNS